MDYDLICQSSSEGGQGHILNTLNTSVNANASPICIPQRCGRKYVIDPGQSWQILRCDWPVCVQGCGLAKVIVKAGRTEEEDVTLCRVGKSSIGQQSDLNRDNRDA